jgi:AraC-like DNA-binding protein
MHKKVIPYWERGSEWNPNAFFMKRLETKAPLKASEIPLTTLPLFGFLFLTEGEVLADIDGESCLCRGGQFLLIPENTPFSVHYYHDLVGYAGFFPLSYLQNVSYRCLSGKKPVLHTFWFDEAAFVGELLDRMTAALARKDDGYIVRALDLLLYGLKSPAEEKAHPLVGRFMELLFDRTCALDSVSGYAARLNISSSYLNKLVRAQTRHSAMEWVEIARVNWAKSLLRDRSHSIAEVSYAIGIDDPSYFTRFFRKYTKLTPSEFRREVEKSGDAFSAFLDFPARTI